MEGKRGGYAEGQQKRSKKTDGHRAVFTRPQRCREVRKQG